MKFTRLRLAGFKSFVDPTDLLIEPGLTGVVGPNGCGKSNLVEAMRWVMGETSAKSLRGSGMEDVIFSGSGNRPGRNMAEVVLTIDNEERRAPASFNEHDALEISRKIERDKGSDYKINGKDVRAKDVQLLFADLSSGAHSPALVRQGQISVLVNAKPRDRRMILEEAAGISGLHSRRHEAELRLRAAETNLTRVEDVVQQLETQLTSLKRQAKQANRYKTLSENIRKWEAIVLFLKWKDASDSVLKTEADFRELEQLVASLTEESAGASTAQIEASEGLPQLREAEAAASAALHRLTVERDTLEAEENRARQEAAKLENLLAQITSDMSREQASLDDGAQELARLVEEAEALQSAEAGQEEARAQADETATRDGEALSEAERNLDAANQETAQFQAKRSSLSRQKGELDSRKNRLTNDLDKVVREQSELQAQGADPAAIAEAQAGLAGLETALSDAENAAQNAEQARGTAQSAERDARDPMQEADRNVSALEAEAKTLARMLQSEESDLWPPLVDSITVEPGFEAALGAALGDDLELPTDDAAPMFWATLGTLENAPALPDGVRALSEVVRAPDAAARRLSQVGIVSKDQGPALQRRLKAGQRLVTVEGDLWRWDGVTVAAEAPTPAAVRLAQKNRLADLEKELEAARSGASAAREAYHAARVAAEKAGEEERAAREAVRQAQSALGRGRNQLAELEKSANRHASRLAALGEARQRLEGEISELTATLNEVIATLDELGDGSDLTAKVTEMRESVAALRIKAAESRAALENMRREAQARANRLQEIQNSRGGWEARKARAAEQLEQLAERKDKTAGDLEAAKLVPGQIAEKREGLAGALEAAEAKRVEAANALQEAENSLREADSRARSVQGQVSEARENRARQEAKLIAARERVEDVAARIQEEMECKPEDVLEKGGVGEDEELPPLAELERRLERQKRERENLGAVNLRAEEESAEYSEQLETLNTEREDLTQAIGRLRQGISSLNKEGRERLLTAFDNVNVEFKRLYTTLFGGGTAQLELVESDDPLEAGLEIIARPPGKKPQSLSLLSGGEQALTAMALIFAVFLSNPAPICVLDEVDAPLDDTNVERFCNLLDEITKNTDTRFLIITHHALTMSRMDRLYGVTMAERGVSKLVSVDLTEAERVVAAE